MSFLQMQQRSNIRCIVHEFPTNTTKYKIDSSIDLRIKRKKIQRLVIT